MAEPTLDTAQATASGEREHSRPWTLERALTELGVVARRRFVKDFSLPIAVLSNPYFEYFIEIYAEILNTKRKLGYLVDGLNKFGGNEHKFVEYQNSLSSTIMEAIRQTAGYKRLIDGKSAEDMERFQQQHADTKSRLAGGVGGKLYSSPNSGKYFISLDLVTANFNSLKYYDPSIVLGCNNWQELLRKFTDLEYYIHSKYFRQIIFGHLNPKKSATITKYITSEVFKAVSSIPKSDSRFDLQYYSHDELVFHCTGADGLDAAGVRKVLLDDVASLRNQLDKLLPDFSPIVRLEVFRLKQIDPTKAFFVKEDLDLEGSPQDELKISAVVFKCVSAAFFAQAFKRYKQLPITAQDRKVYFEGHVATLDNDVFSAASETEPEAPSDT